MKFWQKIKGTGLEVERDTCKLPTLIRRLLIDNTVPANEIWFEDAGKIVGKIINVGK